MISRSTVNSTVQPSVKVLPDVFLISMWPSPPLPQSLVTLMVPDNEVPESDVSASVGASVSVSVDDSPESFPAIDSLTILPPFQLERQIYDTFEPDWILRAFLKSSAVNVTVTSSVALDAAL